MGDRQVRAKVLTAGPEYGPMAIPWVVATGLWLGYGRLVFVIRPFLYDVVEGYCSFDLRPQVLTKRSC